MRGPRCVYRSVHVANGLTERGGACCRYEEVFVRRSYLQHGVALPARDECDGAVIIDVGANIGLFAMQAAIECPDALVFAFEPVAVVAQVLRNNTAQYPNVHVIQAGVGAATSNADDPEEWAYFPDMPGQSSRQTRVSEALAQMAVVQRAKSATVRDSGEDSCGGASSTAHTKQGDDGSPTPQAKCRSVACRAPLVTLSHFLAQARLAWVDLLKIDVEGDELDVLEGVRQPYWRRIQHVAMEVHDVDGRLAAVVELLQDPRRGGFARVTTQRQTTSVVDGYLMVIPDELKLYYVFATRVAATTDDSKACVAPLPEPSAPAAAAAAAAAPPVNRPSHNESSGKKRCHPRDEPSTAGCEAAATARVGKRRRGRGAGKQ